MSSDSFSSYRERSEGFRGFTSSSKDEREKARSAYSKRVHTARKTMDEKKEAPQRDTSDLYDKKLVKLKITSPKVGTKKVHVVLIDNSGSNRIIAEHMRASSGYLTGMLKLIDPTSEIAFVYFSDHCDGKSIFQEVDFISPDEDGDKILHSTLRHIYNASGGDEAEAIECALWKVCNIDFASATEKHLYLITDVVGHGMGMDSDCGCPDQKDWEVSLRKVMKTFSSFKVIGCSGYEEYARLQHQFLSPERLEYDFIDLTLVKDEYHRRAITANAFLFAVACHTGLQGVEMFLSALYAKWLEEPIFGRDSDLQAKTAIERFGKYIEAPEKEIKAMMKRVFVE